MTTSTSVDDHSYIRLKDVLADISRQRIPIVIVSGALALAGGAYGLLTDKEYEASTIVIPVNDQSGKGGGLGALAAQYGDIASLAGAPLGNEKKSEAIAVLQSELLTERYIKDENLLPILYPKKWDSAKQEWKPMSKNNIPTLWLANRYFKKDIRSVNEEKLTGLVTLRIRWKDPVLAAKWANDLVANTNAYLRNKAIVEAERDIAYLNDQASKTMILEARQAVYALLKEQINNEMVARGREEYALKVIDPAFVPEKPVSLGALVLAPVGLVTGFLLSVFFILGRRVLRVL